MEGYYIANCEIPVRAVQTRGEHLKDLVSAVYKEKYTTPAPSNM